jgi:anaerobic magnesium-protoporphyrin IX monomethyl ester cyclase
LTACDILLVQPPIRDYYLTAKRTVPYGLASIAAACRGRGYRVRVLDALATGKSRPAALPPELAYLAEIYAPDDVSPFALFQRFRHFGYAVATIAERARQSGAAIIGISSLFSAYEDMALACAEAIKRCCPEACIVLGGHHPTAFPERMLEHTFVDIVLRGDGEATLPDLADVLRAQGPLDSVPGIAYRPESGGHVVRPPAYVADLNSLPLPAADLVNGRYYARHGLATLVIAASRGCPMTCSYCCMGAHSHIPYRRRKVGHVMREITNAAEKREIGFIDFEDENIALDRAWFTDLLNRIRRYFGARRPELRAMNGLYPGVLDENTVALMQEAGFQELNLSLGTTDPRQARCFNRSDGTAAFDRALGAAHRMGMTAVGYLIAGAPGQTPLSSVQDLLFLASRRVLVGLSIFYPAPDSLDFNTCRAGGLLPASPLGWRSTALPVDHTTRRSESVTLLRLARILNFMKHCVDTEGRLPAPEPPPRDGRRLSGNRYVDGRHLLRWFLEDGIIRGVTPNGDIYSHPADTSLSQAFLEGLQGVALRGSRY